MNNNSQIVEVRNIIKIDSVGSCIYCGATHGLTDEHVIPFALAGNIILKDASCHNCASITSDFERRVLRGFMLNARTAGKYPTRKPQNRPKSLPLQVKNEGTFQQIDLAPEEHPALLFLPLLESANIFTGGIPKVGLTVCGFETIYFGKNPTNLAKDLGVKSIRITENWDITSFARMLAKISYSYSVAMVGLLPRDQVPVLSLILGTADDASYWLGSSNFKSAVEEKAPTHALAYTWIPHPIDVRKELLVVRVKLFVSSGVSGYEIVTCMRDKHLD